MIKGHMGKDKGVKQQDRFPKDHKHSSHGISIRPANFMDGIYIAYLSEQVFGIYGSYSPIISQWFTSQRCRTLMAHTENGPVGFVMTGPLLIDKGSLVASEVLAIAVDPGYQANGIGSMLLQAIEDQAQKMHVEQLVLHTARNNKSALRLFEAHGFCLKRSISRFYPKGQDALEMMKTLSHNKRLTTTG